MVKYADGFYVFNLKLNLIAKFNLDGKNVRNIYLDSLPLDYLSIIQHYFSGEEYEHIKHFIDKNKIQKEKMFLFENIFQIDDQHLGITGKVKIYYDSSYYQKPALYERKCGLVLVLDTGLKSTNLLSFDTFSNSYVLGFSQTHFKDSLFYFIRYIPEWKKEGLSLFKWDKKSHVLKLMYDIPLNLKRTSNFFIHSLNQFEFLLYFSKGKKKYIYRFDTNTNQLYLLLSTKRKLGIGYKTGLSNYLFLNFDAQTSLKDTIIGYHTSTKNYYYPAIINSSTDFSQHYYFMKNNKLITISLLEN